MSYMHQESRHLIIAIPLAEGNPARMLGKCDKLAIFQVDQQSKKVLYESIHEAPPHEPGELPSRLHQLGIDVVLAGEMGKMARDLFQQKGIDVVMNVPPETPAQLVADFLDGKLATGDVVRDH